MICGSASAGPVTKVQLTLQEPAGVARANWPVTSGVPFAKGVLTTADGLRPANGLRLADGLQLVDGLRLVDVESGKTLPLQQRVTCRWPDGSVKWLLIDSQVSLNANETRKLALIASQEAAADESDRANAASIETARDDRGLAVSTGPLRLLLRPGANLPEPVAIDRNGDGLYADGEQVAAAPWRLILEMADGRSYASDVLPANVTVEEKGPIRTAVKVEGQLADAERKPACRYLVRLHFFAGRPWVKAFVTLIVDVPDRVMVDVRSFKLMIPGGASGDFTVEYGGDGGKGNAAHRLATGGAEHRLFQVDDRAYRLDGREAGRRAAGWAQWTNGRTSVAAGVRHFWQQWPKALSAGKEGLAIELIPAFEAGLYDGGTPVDHAKWTYALRGGKTRIKNGLAKTHEVWVWYGPCGEHGEPAADVFRQAFDPLLATCEPAYICATKTLGDFPPANAANPDGFLGYDRIVSKAMSDHLADREETREFGLLNWGDWWGERGYNWGNLEYDMQRGLIVQYARTGRREYYLRAEEAARHHIDVDVVHAVNPEMKNASGPPPAAGDVWVHATGHTGGYFDDGAFGLEKPYTLGYSRNRGHVWCEGDFDYYYLSGDERAREVGLLIAEALRKDAAPSFRIGTHNRDIGWPMRAMMAAYRATGETKYLDAVRRGWEVLKTGEDPGGGWVVKLAPDHCLHKPARCRGNVTFMVGIVISSLCDYHRETGDEEVARSIVRAVDFTLRETYVADEKMFRYTSCPLSRTVPSSVMFVSEGLAYAYGLTRDEKYRRVQREASETLMKSFTRAAIGKQFSQFLILSPEGLCGLDPSAQNGP